MTTCRTFGPTSTSTKRSFRQAETRRILGIDPGSRVTGWGFIEADHGKVKKAEFGCLRPPRGASRALTLSHLADQLETLVSRLAPEVVAVETPFAARFPRAALALAETRGALLAALGRWGGEVVEYEPARVKSAIVGYGLAEKRQVIFMVQRELGLVEAPSADAADALALALCHLRMRRLDLRAANVTE